MRKGGVSIERSSKRDGEEQKKREENTTHLLTHPKASGSLLHQKDVCIISSNTPHTHTQKRGERERATEQMKTKGFSESCPFLYQLYEFFIHPY